LIDPQRIQTGDALKMTGNQQPENRAAEAKNLKVEEELASEEAVTDGKTRRIQEWRRVQKSKNKQKVVDSKGDDLRL